MAGSTEISMLVGMDSANALKALRGIYDGIADVAKIARRDMDIRLEASKGLEGLRTAKKMINDLQAEAKKKLDLLLNTDVAERDVREIQKQLADIQKLSGMEVEIDFDIDNQPLEELTGIPAVLSGAFSGLGGMITGFLNPLNLIPNIFSAISGAVGIVQGAFSGLISVMSTIGSLVSSAIMLPFQAVSAVFNTITGVISSVVGGFTDLVFFVGNLGQAFDTLVRFAQPVINFFTGIYDSLSNAVNVTADFERQISNVASVTKASAADMDLLTQAALKTGATTSLTASQAADALYKLGSAGLSTKDAINSLAGTAKLAEATQSDLVMSTELVVSTLSQYGMEATQSTKVANIFAAGISSSQLNMDRLAESMKYVGPLAGNLGMSLEATVATLGALHNAGIMGERAGTALRNAFTDMLNPVGGASKVLGELGLSLEGMTDLIMDSTAQGLNPFVTTLDLLKSKGIDTAQAMQLFGDRGGPAMVALLGMGTQAIKDMEVKVTGTNAAFEMAEVQLNNYRGSSIMLQSAIESLQITIGKAFQPALTLINKALTDVVFGMLAWIANTGLITTATSILTGITQVFLGALNLLQPVITVIVGAFTALGTILATVGDTFVKFISNNEAFKNSFSAVGNVITVLATTLQGFIANITGLSPSVLTLGANLETLRTTVAAYINQLLAGKSVQDAFKNIINSILLVVKTLGTSLVTITMAVMQFIGSFQFQSLATAEGILNAIATAIQGLASYLTESINTITLWAAEFIKSGEAFNTLKSIFNTGITVIKGVVNVLLLIPAAIGNIIPTISKLADGLSNAFVKLTEGNISGAIQQTFDTVSKVIIDFISAVAGNRDKLTGAFKQIFDGIANGFEAIKKNVIIPMIASFKLALESGLLSSLSEIAVKIAEGIKTFGNTLTTGLTQVFKGMKSIGTLLKEALGSNTGETSKLFSPIVEAVKQGIELIKVTINEGIPAIADIAKPLFIDFIKALVQVIDFLPVNNEIKKGMTDMLYIIKTGVESGQVEAAFVKLKDPIIKVFRELIAEIKKLLSDDLKNTITSGLDFALAAIITGIGIWGASISTTLGTSVSAGLAWFSTTGIGVAIKAIGTWFAGTAILLPTLIIGFSTTIGQYLIEQGFVWAGYITTALTSAAIAFAIIGTWPAAVIALISTVGLAIYNYLIGHSLIDDIPMWFGEVFQATADYFGTVGEMLATPFMAIWNFITETVDTISEYATQIGDAIINTVTAIFDGGASIISTSFNAIWTFMVDTINTVIGYGTEIGNGLINTINDLITTGKDIIVNSLSAIWETIKGMIQTVIDIGKNIGEGLMNAITGAIEAGVQAIDSVLNGIVTTAQATYDKIMAIVNAAKEVASGLGNLVTTGTLSGGVDIQLGEAMMATGGIIKAQRGGTLVRAAEAGVDEAYVPLSNGSIPVSINALPNLSALTNSAPSNNININFGDVQINTDTDEKEFFNKIEKAVSSALIRKNGRR